MQRTKIPDSKVPMTLEAVVARIAPAPSKRAPPGHAPGPGPNPSGKIKRPGTKPQPNPIHHGSGKPMGVLHDAPVRGGAVNDQNYAGQKIGGVGKGLRRR